MHNVSEWKSCTILKLQFIDLLLVKHLFGDNLDIKIMRILNTLPARADLYEKAYFRSSSIFAAAGEAFLSTIRCCRFCQCLFLSKIRHTYKGLFRTISTNLIFQFWTPYLTGRRRLYTDTQGVVLSWGLTILSGKCVQNTKNICAILNQIT